MFDRYVRRFEHKKKHKEVLSSCSFLYSCKVLFNIILLPTIALIHASTSFPTTWFQYGGGVVKGERSGRPYIHPGDVFTDTPPIFSPPPRMCSNSYVAKKLRRTHQTRVEKRYTRPGDIRLTSPLFFLFFFLPPLLFPAIFKTTVFLTTADRPYFPLSFQSL